MKFKMASALLAMGTIVGRAQLYLMSRLSSPFISKIAAKK